MLDDDGFDCHCEWAEIAKEAAKSRSRTIDALWDVVDGYSWTYRTDIPHVGFDVMEGGETYCRGIVFDIAALDLPVEK